MQRPHAAPIARSASGKRAAVRRGRACSTAATRANVTALSPKSETKLPKKHAPNGGRPSALPSAVVSAIPPVVVQPNAKYEMGVDVSDAITPRPSPAGTAVLRLRNSPARAASPAYSATMIWTTTNGENVGLRSVLTADVRTPTATPTAGPASAPRGAAARCPAAAVTPAGVRAHPGRRRAVYLRVRVHAPRRRARARGVCGARNPTPSYPRGGGRVRHRCRDRTRPERGRRRRRCQLPGVQSGHEIRAGRADSPRGNHPRPDRYRFGCSGG